MGRREWKFASLSEGLCMSLSAVHRSLGRCAKARLISIAPFDYINISNVTDFLLYGVPYVFAVAPGKIVRGIATAHSAPPLNSRIVTENDHYVWPYIHGDIRGQTIEPLYPQAPEAALADPEFYELLALVDAVRAGTAREKTIASSLLKERLQEYAERY